jgi:hypothetical protein
MNLETRLESYAERNALKYMYYNGDKLVYAKLRKGGKDTDEVIPLSIKTDVCKVAVDTFRAKISPSFISGREDITKLLTNRIMTFAIKDALIAGVSFIRVSKFGEEIIVENIDSMHCTGIINPDGTMQSALVDNPKWGYEWCDSTIKMNDYILEAHEKGIAPIIPITFNPNVTRPFGVGLIDSAMRSNYKETMKQKFYQSEVISEYGKSNKWLFGLSPDFRDDEEHVGDVFALSEDADGGSPKAGQWTPENPSTLADAISKTRGNLADERSEDEQDLIVRQAQDDFAECFVKVLDLIQAFANDVPYKPTGGYSFVWKPIHDVDFMKLAEGVQMVNLVAPGYFGKEQLDELFGMKGNAIANLASAQSDLDFLVNNTGE